MLTRLALATALPALVAGCATSYPPPYATARSHHTLPPASGQASVAASAQRTTAAHGGRGASSAARAADDGGYAARGHSTRYEALAPAETIPVYADDLGSDERRGGTVVTTQGSPEVEADVWVESDGAQHRVVVHTRTRSPAPPSTYAAPPQAAAPAQPEPAPQPEVYREPEPAQVPPYRAEPVPAAAPQPASRPSQHAPVMCSGNERVTIHDQTVRGGSGPAVIATGGCQLRLSESVIKGEPAIIVRGGAHVSLVESRILGDIVSNGEGQVELHGSSHRGLRRPGY